MKKCSIPSYIFLALLAGVAIFPVLFVISNSFMSSAEIISRYSAEILARKRSGFRFARCAFCACGTSPRTVRFRAVPRAVFEKSGVPENVLEFRCNRDPGFAWANDFGAADGVWF